jgi:nicotinate-nucleotide adenylyltransferase
MPTKKRIGIFRGTFDPIHDGHVSFTQSAMISAKLDVIYYIPEPNPVHKDKVSDFQKRLDLISVAIEGKKALKLLDDVALRGSIGEIIPRLNEVFSNDQLVFIMGSDIAKTLPKWKDLKSLCGDNELVIGLRGKDTRAEVAVIIDSLKSKPRRTIIIKAPMPNEASSTIREKLLSESDS